MRRLIISEGSYLGVSVTKWYHFIGIGGIGMSALAHVLVDSGYKVTGSDLKLSSITSKLEERGVEITEGHSKNNIKDGIDMVVFSTAVSRSNVEIIEAQNKYIPVIKRVELLGNLMDSLNGIAVTGTHGKTTTSSMIALVLDKAGFSPTVAIGGELEEIGGNGKKGTGSYLVAEVDESDGSFVHLTPKVAVVTNIEDDHLPYYGSMQSLKNAYKNFLDKVLSSGKAILCFDDPVVKNLALNEYTKEYVSYGLKSEADYTAQNIIAHSFGSSAEIYYRNEKIGSLKLRVPGKHNLSNALAAIASCEYLGLRFQDIISILEDFQGAKRRFQLIGEKRGIKIIDDYAHHPTEITTTLKTASETHKGRLIVVFQPHRYTRTKQLYKELGASFNLADHVIITSIYAASEEPIEGISAEIVAETAKKNTPDKPIYYLPDHESILNYLHENVCSGDMVLTLGAGDIWKIGVLYAQKLGA